MLNIIQSHLFEFALWRIVLTEPNQCQMLNGCTYYVLTPSRQPLHQFYGLRFVILSWPRKYFQVVIFGVILPFYKGKNGSKFSQMLSVNLTKDFPFFGHLPLSITNLHLRHSLNSLSKTWHYQEIST